MITVDWLDAGVEAQCAPNPAYPNGVEIDLRRARNQRRACSVDLPYPAKRIGAYLVECKTCGTNALITTAGRADDPRKVTLPCKPISGNS